MLLGSSYTVVLSVHAAQTGQQRRLVMFIGLTMLLGLAFLGIKFTEYAIDIEEGLVPSRPGFNAEQASPARSDEFLGHVRLFLVLYYVMTGLHASHMVIGLGLFAWLLVLAKKGAFTPEHHTHMSN